MKSVKTWLSPKVTDFFDIGKQKYIPQYGKCLNSGGDYVEKYLSMYLLFYVYDTIFIACFVNISLEITL
jgi:hypothetical protein